MKKSLLVALALTGLVSGSAIAQEPMKKGAKEEVKMEIVNGVKTLTIRSSAGAYPTEEIYTGEEAEKKMAEIEAAVEAEKKDEKTVEVKMVKKGRKKQLTIITTENGVATEEVFKGKKANAKIKELQSEEGDTRTKVIIEKKEKVIEKSVD